MNSIFFEPEKISPEMNAVSLLLKESFYLWTPLIHILFDSRFYSLFYKSKRERMARRINKEIEEKSKNFNKNDDLIESKGKASSYDSNTRYCLRYFAKLLNQKLIIS
jgi:hypothetical protein